MRAVAEGEVTPDLAPDVALRRTRAEGTLVAVARRVEQHHFATGRNRPAADHDLARGRARKALHRRRQPQELLDGALHACRLLAQQRALRGVAREQLGRHPEQAGRRIVAPGHHRERHAEQLRRRHRPAVEFRVHEGRDHVVGRVAAALLDQCSEIGEEFADGVLGTEDVAGRVGGDDGVTPRVEAVAIGLGHTERMGDDEARQRLEQFGDDIGLAHLAQPFDPLDDEGPDERSDRAHLPGRETRRGELAQGRVVGRVHHHDGRFDAEFLHLAVAEGQALCGGEGREVDGRLHHVVEARQHPVVAAVGLHLVHGIVVAQSAIHGERVAPGLGAARDEGGIGAVGHRIPRWSGRHGHS